MELTWIILFALIMIGVSVYAFRRMPISVGSLGVFAKLKKFSFSIQTVIGIVLLGWLLLWTPVGAGIIAAGSATATWAGCGLQRLSGDVSADCATQRATQVAQQRQAEVERAAHIAAVEAAAYVPQPVLPLSVEVPACGNTESDWVEVAIPAGWTFVPAWQEAIASFQVLPNDSSVWDSDPANTAGGVGAVRFCTDEIYYQDKKMNLTWRQM